MLNWFVVVLSVVGAAWFRSLGTIGTPPPRTRIRTATKRSQRCDNHHLQSRTVVNKPKHHESQLKHAREKQTNLENSRSPPHEIPSAISDKVRRTARTQVKTSTGKEKENVAGDVLDCVDRLQADDQIKKQSAEAEDWNRQQANEKTTWKPGADFRLQAEKAVEPERLQAIQPDRTGADERDRGTSVDHGTHTADEEDRHEDYERDLLREVEQAILKLVRDNEQIRCELGDAEQVILELDRENEKIKWRLDAHARWSAGVWSILKKADEKLKEWTAAKCHRQREMERLWAEEWAQDQAEQSRETEKWKNAFVNERKRWLHTLSDAFLTWIEQMETLFKAEESRATIQKLPEPMKIVCWDPVCAAAKENLGVTFCKHSIKQLVDAHAYVRMVDVAQILRILVRNWHPDRFTRCNKAVQDQVQELAKIMNGLVPGQN